MTQIIKIDLSPLKEKWQKTAEYFGIPSGKDTLKITDSFRKVHKNLVVSSWASIIFYFIDHSTGEECGKLHDMQKIKLPFLGSEASIEIWKVGIFFCFLILYNFWRFNAEKEILRAAQWKDQKNDDEISERVSAIDKLSKEINTELDELYNSVINTKDKFSIFQDIPVPNEKWNKAIEYSRNEISQELQRIVKNNSDYVDPDRIMNAFDRIDNAKFPLSKTDIDSYLLDAKTQLNNIKPYLNTKLVKLPQQAQQLLSLKIDLIGSQRRDYIFHWQFFAIICGVFGLAAGFCVAWEGFQY